MHLREILETPLQALREAPLSPVDVAVLDSGIDSSHPDLARFAASAWQVAESAGSADSAVVAAPAASNNDHFNHGTGVASIVTQIAPNARLHDIRVVGSETRSLGESLLAGLRFAIEREYRVINLSLACSARLAWQLQALAENAYLRDLMIIAARRNRPLTDQGFPAQLASVVGVDCGTYPSLLGISYRNRFPIEFAANGENVSVAAAGGGYTAATGTSFATPAVSGMAALLLGICPALTPFELKAALKHHAGGNVAEEEAVDFP